MKINIIGGEGLVGYGIYLHLKKYHDVKIYSWKEFDNENLKYRDNNVFKCDLFIHAAGVTDELVKEDIGFASYKSNSFIKYLVRNLILFNCRNIVYISTIHLYGDLSRKICQKTKPNPQSEYAKLHLIAENNFQNLIKQTDINFLSLRLPHVYGFSTEINKINRPDIIQFNSHYH